MPWPHIIPATQGKADIHYELANDCHAVRLAAGAAAPADALFVLGDEEDIAVVRGEPASPAGAGDLAVYRLHPGGALGVATGRVFLRFAETALAESARAPLEQAGFRIESMPSWAPHTCWVVAESGNPAEALSRLAVLSGLPGVIRAEPQLLLCRQFKPTPGSG